MAQPMLCDAHGAPGVMLMNTLIPPVESLVFCPECLPAQVVLMFEQLGLAQEFADVVRAEERAKIEADKPKRARGRAAASDAPETHDTAPASEATAPADPEAVA